MRRFEESYSRPTERLATEGQRKRCRVYDPALQLGEGVEEEEAEAAAGGDGERWQLDGVVAAGEEKRFVGDAVGVEGVEELLRVFGPEGGVVAGADEQGALAVGAEATDVGKRADGRLPATELVEADFGAETFPDVHGGHAGGDDVGEIGGDVEKRAGAEERVVGEGDEADGRADGGAEDAEAVVALRGEPVEGAASVGDGLAIGGDGEADVGADEVVGARVAGDGAAVVVRHAEAQSGDAENVEPAGESDVGVGLGVPVREDEDGGAGMFRAEETGVDGIVLGPGRRVGGREREDAVGGEAIVGGGRGGVEVVAARESFRDPTVKEGARVGVIGTAADVLEAPGEGEDAAVVVHCPATVLVAADGLFEPAHGSQTNKYSAGNRAAQMRHSERLR